MRHLGDHKVQLTPDTVGGGQKNHGTGSAIHKPSTPPITSHSSLFRLTLTLEMESLHSSCHWALNKNTHTHTHKKKKKKRKSRIWLPVTVKTLELISCPDQIPRLIPYASNWQTSGSMQSFDLTLKASTASRFATSPPQIFSVNIFLSVMLALFCSGHRSTYKGERSLPQNKKFLSFNSTQAGFPGSSLIYFFYNVTSSK